MRNDTNTEIFEWQFSATIHDHSYFLGKYKIEQPMSNLQ